jgi:phage-related holin
VGLNMTQPLIVLGITFWLIGSESVSILQNLHEIGVIAPKWFKKSVKSVQEVMENREVE